MKEANYHRSIVIYKDKETYIGQNPIPSNKAHQIHLIVSLDLKALINNLRILNFR